MFLLSPRTLLLILFALSAMRVDRPGPSCSKRRYLNKLVKGHFVNCFSGFNIQYSDIFCWKMWVAVALQKLLTFFSKKFQHICVSLDVNFNESLTNDVVSFEQLGPDYYHLACWEKNQQTTFWNLFLIFPRQLAFHANCFLWMCNYRVKQLILSFIYMYVSSFVYASIPSTCD